MSTIRLTPDEIIKILEDLGAGLIDQTEAARRAHLWDTEPEQYRCGTCQHCTLNVCHLPGHPPTPVNPHDVRCGSDYIERRDSDEALPAEPKRSSSRMFK